MIHVVPPLSITRARRGALLGLAVGAVCLAALSVLAGRFGRYVPLSADGRSAVDAARAAVLLPIGLLLTGAAAGGFAARVQSRGQAAALAGAACVPLVAGLLASGVARAHAGAPSLPRTPFAGLALLGVAALIGAAGWRRSAAS